MTFFSNAIPVLSRVLLILSAMLLPMLLYYFLVVEEGEKYTKLVYFCTTFSSIGTSTKKSTDINTIFSTSRAKSRGLELGL